MMTLGNKEKAMSRSGIARRLWQHENTPILLVLTVMIGVVVLVEYFMKGRVNFISGMNISNVLLQVSVTGIFALGMTLVMISGGIDLSIGNMLSFLGTGMAYLMRTAKWGEAETLLIALVVGVGLQLLMGWIISRTKIEPFIISLGFMSIYRGFTYLITNGREITIIGKIEFLQSVVFRLDKFVVTVPIVLFIALTIIVALVVKYTKFGRRVYAVGGNENAAYLAGINVKNFKLLIYGINGLFVTIASMTLLARLGTGAPVMGLGKEIEVIAAVVVGGTAMSGGKGNIWGAVFGVLVLGIISNALNILGVSPHYQFIISGLLIIFAVIVGYYSGLRTVKRTAKKA
ncbi:MAG TPA: ribose ABC transporter permease [Clostridiales bacterium]|jgi:ribose/xylose/arabinose/galactoside ABC-type transport system permease subunit|nr:ribose ABC transporter permease [Clostridiales bacterium]